MSNFQLVSKTLGTRFSQYKKPIINLIGIPPRYIDEVIMSSKDAPDKISKIITLRDSKGKIVQRLYDIEGKPLRARLYKYSDTIIGDDEFVKSTQIKNVELERNMFAFYNDSNFASREERKSLWQSTYEIVNHLSENINTGKRILSQMKVETFGKVGEQKHSLREFPHIINNKVDNSISKKQVEFNVKDDEVIKNSIVEINAKIDKKDSFLPYRALSLDSLKSPITRKFIKDRHINDLDIKIVPEYAPKIGENFLALFNSEQGKILFNKEREFKSKSKFISISSHEVEHGWQYQLYARLTGGDTHWEKIVAKNKGPLFDTSLISEAESYVDSIENYIPHYKNFKKYKTQKIEAEAFNKGLKTRNQYDREGRQIRKSFPHIPEEFL